MSGPHKTLGPACEYVRHPDGSWQVRAHDIDLLVEWIGRGTLASLCRCLEASDRLMSLVQLMSLSHDHLKSPSAIDRNTLTAMWLAAGTMRELALAIDGLGRLKGRISPDGARRLAKLQIIAQRWNTGMFEDVRNTMSFHLDPGNKLFAAGVDQARRLGEPLIIGGGDDATQGASTFPFGRDLFILGLWPVPADRERDMARFARALRCDQIAVGRLVQKILIDLLRGQSKAKVSPADALRTRRHQLVRVLTARLRRSFGSAGDSTTTAPAIQ